MAILKDTWEIKPVAPSLDGPEDAYDVRLWITGLPGRGAPNFEHRYNVAGWQGGHLDIYRMADSFQMARYSVGKRFPDIPPDGEKEPATPFRSGHYTDLRLHFDVIWLHAIVGGFLWDEGPRLSVRLFLWVSPDTGYAPNTPSEDVLVRFVSEEFFVSPDEAEAFGMALKQECIHAQNERRRLDITHFDDFVDFSE